VVSTCTVSASSAGESGRAAAHCDSSTCTEASDASPPASWRLRTRSRSTARGASNDNAARHLRLRRQCHEALAHGGVQERGIHQHGVARIQRTTGCLRQGFVGALRGLGRIMPPRTAALDACGARPNSRLRSTSARTRTTPRSAISACDCVLLPAPENPCASHSSTVRGSVKRSASAR
jgi:hypothetical protein